MFPEGIDFNDYIEAYKNGAPITNTPPLQTYEWYNHDGVTLDFVGRFDRMQQDVEYISQQIGIPTPTIPHLNSTIHNHYTTYYNDKSIQTVYQLFKDDIDKYEFEFGG